MSYFEALRFLHRVYRGYPLRHRVHVFIRFVTCPFLRILGDLPPAGRMLEIGAGHGILSYFAARDAQRRVVAVEPDLRKTLQDTHPPGVKWIAGYDDAIRGTFDTIVICDVTYRLAIEDRTSLYRRIFERLGPGGTFVLKEMDPMHRLKMSWTRAQEWVSDHMLELTLGRGFIYQTRAEVESALREIGFEAIRGRAIDRGYPHPHFIYTARKPVSSA